jgi:cold shock CspA family protein
MMAEPYQLQTPKADEGFVKSYDEAAGKGLIARAGNEDVHVNRAGLKDESVQSLKTGDRVRFQVMESPKGSFAFAVRKLQAAV